MTYRGRCTVALTLAAARSVTVTNDDAVHATYVDFLRPDTRAEARRVLEPGDSEIVALAPGVLEIALGPSAVLEDA